MITGLFKLIFNLIRLALLLVVLVLIFHTWAIKQALKFSLSWSLGTEVSISEVKMDWKNTGFEVHGLEIDNPSSFPPGILADIPLVIVSIDFGGFSHGNLHFKTIGFDLRDLQVIHSEGQGLNIMELKPLKGEKDRTGRDRLPSETEQRARDRQPRVIIDELIMSIGNITLIESFGKMQKQKIIRVGIKGDTYYNLEGTNDIVQLVVSIAVKKLGYDLFNEQAQKLVGKYAIQTKELGFLERLKKAITS